MVDGGNTYGERVSRLVGWGHWFAFFNILAAMLVGSRYVIESTWPSTLIGKVYLILSWIGHFGFLVFAIYILILFPLTFLIPSRKLLRFVAVCFATAGLIILLIDTQTYDALNLHLNPVVWQLLFSDDGPTFSKDLQHLFILLPLIFALELAMSEWVWRKQRKLSHKHIGRPIAALFFISFISSHLIYVWSDAYIYPSVTNQRTNFPLSYPMTAKSFMEKHGLFDREEYLKRLDLNPTSADQVNYPKDVIRYDRRSNNLNILMVSVNNLRGDMLNQEAMPSTYAFSKQNLNFANHYSSSNDMFGLFGLFYGLPASYEGDIKAQGTAPVLIDVLREKQYQFSLFSGNNFDDPLYSETIFRGLQLNKITFTDQTSRDNQVIGDWEKWTTGQKGPWFSYLELTTVQDFNVLNQKNKNQSAAQILRSNYNLSVKTADNELDTLYSKLSEMNLLDTTIVIITSNHGTEFNETQTNSWGSNTNYSSYQLKVPMVIHWPGRVSSEFNRRTSHLDLSVTLLQEVFGVSSNPADFSSGTNLFDESPRRWILAGDSRELALITDTETTVVDKFGNFKVYDESYRRKKETNPTLPVLMQGLTELQRFYSKDN
jgi:uncharacterized protein